MTFSFFFFFLQDIDICNFANDMTPFVCYETLESVLHKLEGNSELTIIWLVKNYIKLNTDKCHLLVYERKYGHSWAKIGDDKIWQSTEVKLSGVNNS